MQIHVLIIAGFISLTLPIHAAGPVLGANIAAAARQQIGKTIRYDPAYRALSFPGGDVPIDAVV